MILWFWWKWDWKWGWGWAKTTWRRRWWGYENEIECKSVIFYEDESDNNDLTCGKFKDSDQDIDESEIDF